MSVMKTSLTIIPMCPRELLSHYKELSSLIICYKKDWATLLHFIYFIYLLLVTIYLITKLILLPTISVLAEKTLLKAAYHFLLLLVGFDTLTYRKDYDRSPTLVGHHPSIHASLEYVIHTHTSLGPAKCINYTFTHVTSRTALI